MRPPRFFLPWLALVLLAVGETALYAAFLACPASTPPRGLEGAGPLFEPPEVSGLLAEEVVAHLQGSQTGIADVQVAPPEPPGTRDPWIEAFFAENELAAGPARRAREALQRYAEGVREARFLEQRGLHGPDETRRLEELQLAHLRRELEDTLGPALSAVLLERLREQAPPPPGAGGGPPAR